LIFVGIIDSLSVDNRELIWRQELIILFVYTEIRLIQYLVFYNLCKAVE